MECSQVQREWVALCHCRHLHESFVVHEQVWLVITHHEEQISRGGECTSEKFDVTEDLQRLVDGDYDLGQYGILACLLETGGSQLFLVHHPVLVREAVEDYPLFASYHLLERPLFGSFFRTSQVVVMRHRLSKRKEQQLSSSRQSFILT
jgi:hypothetical protein